MTTINIDKLNIGTEGDDFVESTKLAWISNADNFYNSITSIGTVYKKHNPNTKNIIAINQHPNLSNGAIYLDSSNIYENNDFANYTISGIPIFKPYLLNWRNLTWGMGENGSNQSLIWKYDVNTHTGSIQSTFTNSSSTTRPLYFQYMDSIIFTAGNQIKTVFYQNSTINLGSFNIINDGYTIASTCEHDNKVIIACNSTNGLAKLFVWDGISNYRENDLIYAFETIKWVNSINGNLIVCSIDGNKINFRKWNGVGFDLIYSEESKSTAQGSFYVSDWSEVRGNEILFGGTILKDFGRQNGIWKFKLDPLSLIQIYEMKPDNTTYPDYFRFLGIGYINGNKYFPIMDGNTYKVFKIQDGLDAGDDTITLNPTIYTTEFNLDNVREKTLSSVKFSFNKETEATIYCRVNGSSDWKSLGTSTKQVHIYYPNSQKITFPRFYTIQFKIVFGNNLSDPYSLTQFSFNYEDNNSKE